MYRKECKQDTFIFAIMWILQYFFFIKWNVSLFVFRCRKQGQLCFSNDWLFIVKFVVVALIHCLWIPDNYHKSGTKHSKLFFLDFFFKIFKSFLCPSTYCFFFIFLAEDKLHRIVSRLQNLRLILTTPQSKNYHF